MATHLSSNDQATGHSTEIRRTSATEGINVAEKDKDTKIEHAIEQAEEGGLKYMTQDELPTRDEIIDQLGIPDWKTLEKKLVRRVDMTLLPMLWILYVFNYLDRASLGQARLSTLDEDLGLTGYQFGNAISVLSAGYVLGQLPSNMIIPYIRPGLYLPGCAILWSGVSASVAGIRSYEGLMAVRFFLGVVEAPLFPGAIYVLSCWYTRREIAVRVAIMSTGVPLANGMSGLIAAAVFGTLEGKHGVAGWQWLFIVLAVVGAGFAALAAMLLPDYPSSRTGSQMWTMTEDMRRIAEQRIIADRVTVASTAEIRTGIWHGLKLSLADYRLWIIVMINITISAAYGFSNFYPAIVRGFGFERTITLVITFPPYFFAAGIAVAIAWSSDKRADRGWHFSIPIAVGMVGYIICMATTQYQVRYAMSYLFIGGLFGANPLINTWITSTLARNPEKKATSIAVNNILGQLGNVMAPYFFVASDEPRYIMAFILMFVMAGVCIASAMALKYSLWRENKKLLKYALEHGTVYNPYIQ